VFLRVWNWGAFAERERGREIEKAANHHNFRSVLADDFSAVPTTLRDKVTDDVLGIK